MDQGREPRSTRLEIAIGTGCAPMASMTGETAMLPHRADPDDPKHAVTCMRLLDADAESAD